MITAATILLIAGGACFTLRALLGPSLADRVIAVDGLVVTIVAVIIVTSIGKNTGWYLDVALVVALVGFLGTTAAARFIERRGG
jgi:multisubunit Na+/H+ antiporter MnhF subunit